MGMNHRSSSRGVSAPPPNPAQTRLHGYWLVLVRLVCLTLGVVSVGLFVASIPSSVAHLHLLCTGTAAACNGSGPLTPDVRRLGELGLSLNFYATYTLVLVSISALGYWLVAAFLFWRKPDDRLALLAAVSLATVPIVFNSPLINTLPPPWWFLARCIGFLGFLCIVLFGYVFPSGHFVSRGTRWVLVVAAVYWGFNEFFPVSSFNPLYLSQVLNGLIFLVIGGGIVVVQIYRYQRVSSPAQRQQTKWVVYGVSMGGGGYLVLLTIFLFFPSLFLTGSLASLIRLAALSGLVLLIPFSIGFAIARSRLWDIDVLINRTLVYGLLTGILTGVYVGLVIGLSTLLHGVISQDNGVAIVISTLAIYMLFQPLHRRIQRIIDRRFYRSRYDAAKTVAAFSTTLRNEVDLDQLREHLLAVVQETMQPAHVSLWLRPPEHDGKQRAPWRATPPGSSEGR